MQREPFVVGFPADDFRRTNWNLRSDLERPVLSPPERDGIQGCLVLCRAGLTFYIRADGKYDEFSKDFREKRRFADRTTDSGKRHLSVSKVN